MDGSKDSLLVARHDRLTAWAATQNPAARGHETRYRGRSDEFMSFSLVFSPNCCVLLDVHRRPKMTLADTLESIPTANKMRVTHTSLHPPPPPLLPMRIAVRKPMAAKPLLLPRPRSHRPWTDSEASSNPRRGQSCPCHGIPPLPLCPMKRARVLQTQQQQQQAQPQQGQWSSPLVGKMAPG